jgi:hypothetical protein
VTSINVRARDLFWRNFVLSVWVLIAWCGWLAARYAAVPRAVDVLEPFASRFFLWPLVIGLMELLFWVLVFRRRRSGTRVMAAFMALTLLLRGLLVNLLSASPSAERVDPVRLAVYSYVSLSHLAFAVWGAGGMSRDTVSMKER